MLLLRVRVVDIVESSLREILPPRTACQCECRVQQKSYKFNYPGTRRELEYELNCVTSRLMFICYIVVLDRTRYIFVCYC